MRVRLKTKLVLAISGMVTAVVVVFASIYVWQIVSQRLNDAYESGDFVAHQIFGATRQALEVDLARSNVSPQDPAAAQRAVETALETDPGLNSLLQSALGYSRPIYDLAIADNAGRALVHTDPNLTRARQLLPQRESFEHVSHGSFRRQLSVVYGEPRVYEIQVPIERNGAPFGTVRVGISTVFLKSELRPQLDRALALSAIAIILTLILAAALSNLALRPLALIGQRLDLMSAGAPLAEAEPPAREADEVNAVTSKINRLGRQMRDVKEVFTALKENMDQVMTNLQDGLVLFTHDVRAILVSAAVEQFLGRSRSQMLGRNAAEFLERESPLGRVVLEAMENRRELAQREVLMEDGRRVQVTLDFMEEGGERMALLTLRNTEPVRRIYDELAFGRLASGAGHEVKNPINAIVVHLEVLRQKLQQLDPDTRRHLDVIDSEIHRLDRVVQMLVDFTRPVDLRLAEADLARIVDEVAALAAPEAEQRGVRILRHTQEPLPVRVDADLMKQVLLNIVLNGIQAMPEGGKLEIKTGSGDCGRTAQVLVRDEGTGIPAEIRDKIFDLYFTTRKSGTGLGLAMAYKTMKLHHGNIDFETAEGAGTVFKLSLPLLEHFAEAQRELAATE